MSNFNDIYGQEGIKTHLQDAIEKNQVSHAYIFNGGDGIGKMMMAQILAKTLQCESQGVNPCNSCASCKQADSGNHPDIHYITHEKPAIISVDEVRNQLVSDIQIKPYSSKHKIYIMDDAQKMNVQAQNAILKTIEEPPAYGIIILLTTNANSLLETIRSRCVVLDFKPVSENLVKQYLSDHCNLLGSKADFAAAFAQGMIGRAKDAAQSDVFAGLSEEVFKICRHVRELTLPEVFSAAKDAVAYKATMDDFLDLFAMWFRDVLIFKSTWDTNRLIFKSDVSVIRDQAEHTTYNGLNDILEAIDKVKVRLKANVTFELALELLYMTIRENM